MSHEIKIASDHHELEPFMLYLRAQGHDVDVSDNDSNYLNGVCSNDDMSCRHSLNVMWDNYCRAQ